MSITEACTTKQTYKLREEIKSSFSDKKLSTYFQLRRVTQTDNEDALLRNRKLDANLLYGYVARTQSLYVVLVWRWRFGSARTTCLTKWKLIAQDAANLFQLQMGLCHRLSVASPLTPRRCFNISQSKLVCSAPLPWIQLRSNRLAPSAGLLRLGHLPNHVLCWRLHSKLTKSLIIPEAKRVSPLPLMKAMRADSLM